MIKENASSRKKANKKDKDAFSRRLNMQKSVLLLYYTVRLISLNITLIFRKVNNFRGLQEIIFLNFFEKTLTYTRVYL